MNSTFKISAGGIIYKKENSKVWILLIKDAWNNWTFSKGFVEESEEYQDTAIREMTEELGIDASKLVFKDDLGEIEYEYIWEGESVHKKVHYFLYEWVIDQEFNLQKEEGIQEVRWVEVEKLADEVGYKENSLELAARVKKQLTFAI